MARTAVVAGTATVAVGAVSGAQHNAAQQKAAAQQAQAAAQQAQIDAAVQQAVAQQAPQHLPQSDPVVAAPAVSAGSTTDDMMTQLLKLGELQKAGILTDDEFAAMKAKILMG
jgi:type II secretory pathway pseudopilin PulG